MEHIDLALLVDGADAGSGCAWPILVDDGLLDISNFISSMPILVPALCLGGIAVIIFYHYFNTSCRTHGSRHDEPCIHRSITAT